MKITLVLATFFGSFLASAALARQNDCNVPMADWQTRAAVKEMAEGQGWFVRRIKTDDGCYEVYGKDAEGRSIEARIDPGSLAIVEIEYEDDHGDSDEPQAEKHDSDDHGGSDD